MKKETTRLFLSFFIIFFILIFALNITVLPSQAQSNPQTNPTNTPSAKTATPQANQNDTSPAVAATPTTLPEITSFNNNALFTFQTLGRDKFTLTYPSSAVISVDLPNYWNVAKEGVYIEFHYDFEMSNPVGVNSNANLMGNSLLALDSNPPVEININDVYISSFFPVVGKNQKARVLIPANTLATLSDPAVNPNNTFTVAINFYRNLSAYCNSDALLTIYEDSFFNFNFSSTPPTRDLSVLPGMIIQGSFLPETLNIVIPDQYNDKDLTTAATLVTFISNSGFRNVNYKMIKASEANETSLAANSALIIGSPSKNSFLSKLYSQNLLPTTLSTDGKILKNGEAVPDGSGVLQLIASPYNKLNTFLLVNGSTEEGAALAAKQLYKTTTGLSSDLYVFDADSDVAAPVAETSTDDVKVLKTTFNSLGFTNRIFRGPGANQTDLTFYIPRNWDIQSGAKILLDFNFSSRLSSVTSVLSVSLNGTPVGNPPFDKTIQGNRTVEIALNAADLQPGLINTITFSTILEPEMDCTEIDPTLYWITLQDYSELDIPYKLITNPSYLAEFTNPFDYLANENNLLIVIPQEPDMEDLDRVSTIVSRVGALVLGAEPLNVEISMNSDLDLNNYKGYNILAIGRPTQNSFVAKHNNDLIQQFVDGKDELKQQKANLELHTPQDVNIGLVEVIPLKSDLFRGMTVFSGTTTTGLQYGIDATEGYYRYTGGDLFFAGPDNSVISYQSSFSTGNIKDVVDMVEPTNQPQITAVPLDTLMPTPEVNMDESSGGINFNSGLLYGVIGMGVVVIILGVIQMSRNRISKR